MALRHSVGLQSSRSTTAGLRTSQNIHSVAVPALGKVPSVLQHVPENTEMDIKAASTVKPKQIFRSEDWNSLEEAVKCLFEGDDLLSKPKELYKLHQNVKNILRSKTGTFLYDYYKQELLPKGMAILTERLKNVTGLRMIQTMEGIWTSFYMNVLPTLEGILYLVKPKGRLTIRTTTLAGFRDIVIFSIDLKGILKEACISKKEISPTIKHMLLILQNVNDCYPPSKNKLLLESTVALVISPYLGYLGLYESEAILKVTSNEPKLASRRRSSADVGGPRRISRPFSIQPLQIDTLNQMFINAIRNKHEAL